MNLTVTIDAKDLQALSKLGFKIDKAARAIIRQTAAEAKRSLAAALRGAGSGRTYEIGTGRAAYKIGRSAMGRKRVERFRAKVSRGIHRASSPGQLPAKMTGTLARSIRARSTRSRNGDFVFVVYADPRTAYYRHFLEFGTRGRRRVLPRPFVQPAQRRWADELERRLNSSVTLTIQEKS